MSLPRVGVSACLLGEEVRYDGRHKRQDALLADFERQVEWVPVCPEVELGLGVPREAIQLENAAGAIRLRSTRTRRDLTVEMEAWAEARLNRLAELELSGYVFKARSPSCALGSAPVSGRTEPSDGLFASALRERFPDIPLADEERLADRLGRWRFLDQARTRAELRELFRPGWGRGSVVAFHSQNKLRLLAHSPESYRRLGRLVARIAEYGRDWFAQTYIQQFVGAIGEEPTPRRLENALLHAAGCFTARLPSRERAGLLAEIAAIGRGAGDLEQVKTAIVDNARRFGHEYLLTQRFLA